MKDTARAAGDGSYNIGRCFLARAAAFINSPGEIIRSREWDARKEGEYTKYDKRKCFTVERGEQKKRSVAKNSCVQV